MAAATDHGIEYGKIFGSWQIRELIGTGSKGRTKVYRITKDAQGGMEAGEERALKAVTVCEDADLEKMTVQARAEYDANRDFLCEKARSEVLLMKRLEGASHIVGYLDWEIRDRTGGTDLLIAMHLLETLEAIQKRRDVFREEEVLQVGMDICEALVWCQKEGIIHRDIKPANIFRRPDGRGGYLLGDFGVSRIVDNGMGASTDIGTPAYAAPEQARGTGEYHGQVDIYSLGVVLYELSNRNRLPFADSRYSTREMIERRVILGEALPVPVDASPALANVILKACAFRPEDRFQTAQELWDALKNIEARMKPADVGIAIPKPKEDPYATVPLGAFVREVQSAAPLAVQIEPREQEEKSFGNEQARGLFTNDMLRDMDGYYLDEEEERTYRKIELTIPQGYTVIEKNAFNIRQFCGIDYGYIHVGRLILPDTIQEIQKGAFDRLRILEYIEIPDSVQVVEDLPSMGSHAYIKCSKNSCARRFKKGKEQYHYRTQKWLIKPCARDLLDDCDGFELVIRRGYEGIEENAFLEFFRDLTGEYKQRTKKVERVIIPDTMKNIGDRALYGIEVTDYIEIPASVKHIGKDAFDLMDGAYVKCEKGTYAYGTCKRRGIPTTPEQARTFGREQAKELFSKAVLEDWVDLLIPEGYTILDSGAFLDFANKENYLIVDRMILPKTMEIIHENAFDGLIISGSIDIPGSVFIISDFPYLGPDAYVKCVSGSDVHIYCQENHIKNLIDNSNEG